jgi:hypothetical protein
MPGEERYVFWSEGDTPGQVLLLPPNGTMWKYKNVIYCALLDNGVLSFTEEVDGGKICHYANFPYFVASRPNK